MLINAIGYLGIATRDDFAQCAFATSAHRGDRDLHLRTRCHWLDRRSLPTLPRVFHRLAIPGLIRAWTTTTKPKNLFVLNNTVRYALRLSRKLSPHANIREKKWGGQVGLRNLPDGGVELHLRLSSLDEVARWLGTWNGKGLPVNSEGLEEMMLKAAYATITAVNKMRAKRLAAKATTETTTPHVATASTVRHNEMEKTLMLVATWSPEIRQEFFRRAAL